MVHAQEESRALAHDHIGTEHLLLGVTWVSDGVAANVMDALDIRAERVRDAVVKIVPRGEEPSPSQLPFTPRAKLALEASLREALGYGTRNIEAEHILLGLLRRRDCTAVRVLVQGLGVDADELHDRLLGGLPSTRASAILARSQVRMAVPDELLGPLRAEVDVIAREIKRNLKRSPDTGDLLLMLAATPGTPAARALTKLGIDLDDLQGAIDASRAEADVVAQSTTSGLDEIRRCLGLPG